MKALSVTFYTFLLWWFKSTFKKGPIEHQKNNQDTKVYEIDTQAQT